MQFPTARLYTGQPIKKDPVYIVIPSFLKKRLESFDKPLTDALDLEVVSGILSPRELKFYLARGFGYNKLLDEMLDSLGAYGTLEMDRYDIPLAPMTSNIREAFRYPLFSLTCGSDENKSMRLFESVFIENRVDQEQMGSEFSYDLQSLQAFAGVPATASDYKDSLDSYFFTIEHLVDNTWGVTIEWFGEPLSQIQRYNVYRGAAEQLFKRYGFRSVVRTGLMAEVIARSQL